jgi:hypothetical protein
VAEDDCEVVADEVAVDVWVVDGEVTSHS